MFQPIQLWTAALLAAIAAQAQPLITVRLTLGVSASTFGVCAATTVTNSGNTVIRGHLGLSPGSSVTGFPPGVASSIQINTASAIRCQSETATTYGTCVGLPATRVLTGVPLGGRTLTPGVYKFATTAELNGVLTLDALFNSNAQFIFQVGTSFLTTVGSRVLLVRGARSCNVFFCVGSSATIGANTRFNGSIIAYTSIGVGTGVVDVGGFYANNGAVTLLGDDISPPKCGLL